MSEPVTFLDGRVSLYLGDCREILPVTPADRARDSRESYDLAIATMREIAIRKHRILPSPGRPDETRWAREGYRGPKALDTVGKAGEGA